VPNWEEIRREWEISDITFKELAEKYGVKDSTIRSRKNREKWQRRNATKNATQRKNVATKKKQNETSKKDIKTEEKPVVESDELTDKQRLFCIYYVKYFNATKAYQKAYDCAYSTAMVEGHRSLRNPKIFSEIERLKEERKSELLLEDDDILQKYIDIAFADITDFVEFGREEVIDINPVTGDEHTIEVNRVKFKDSSEVDGTIITEVKQGKDGVSVKLADKMKALDKLAQYFDLFPDKFKRRIEEEKLKLAQQQKQQVEVETPIFVDDVDEED
jgi:phage terminase small subunit